jgi:hypothetical protein
MFYVLVSVMLVNCKSDTRDVNSDTKTENQNTKIITKKEIDSLTYKDYGLSNDARKAVSDWQKYQELNTQIEYLKTADISFFKSDITLITTFLSDFRAEIPKALNTNEINARITALETKILKLNSLLLLDNISKNEQIEGLKEVFVAFSNLNLQMNKKLEFEAYNILKPE